MTLALVPYWRQAYKLSSIILSTLLAMASSVYVYIQLYQTSPEFPQFLQAVNIAPAKFAGFVIIMGVAIGVARVIQQVIPMPIDTKVEMINSAQAIPVVPHSAEETK